jgi:hypothetical protein
VVGPDCRQDRNFFRRRRAEPGFAACASFKSRGAVVHLDVKFEFSICLLVMLLELLPLIPFQLCLVFVLLMLVAPQG